MKYVKSFLVIFSLFILTAYAQEETKEKFPKAGYVKSDKATVKAGDNANFEDLCILSKSDAVKVIERRYSWFKILLPRKAPLYINKDYVILTSDEKGVGIINANNVNLRAGAGTRYSIIGQVSKPEKISILSEEAGWYKIEAPYGTAGWILSSQIALAEEKEPDNTKQKSATKETKVAPTVPVAAQKKETANSSTVRLGANYPPAKGNLSITTSTKNNR
ncbi:MAG: SH3 domain-containing protein [Candidatus Omnitrophota bacterium]|nr:SH3 domain-containing protein [Candidatus Omnitrophota bacterium]